jgi:hypothetical protein
MAGGISIALAILALLIIGGIVAFMYFTGGLLSLSRGKREKPAQRPTHKRATSPTEENRRFVGTDSGDRKQDAHSVS